MKSIAAVLTIVAAVAGCAGRPPAPVIERTPGAPAPAAPAAREAEPRQELYTVKRGETLYSIALDHGLDYRELAEWNGISNPSAVRAGVVLRLQPSAPAAAAGTESGVLVQPIATPGRIESRPLGPGAASPPSARMPDATTIAGIEPRRAGSGAPEARPGAPVQPAKPEAPPQIAKVEPSPQAAKPPPGQDADDEDKVDWSWPVSGRIVGRFTESGSKGVDIAGRLGDPVIASAPGRVVYSGSGLRGYGKLIIIKHNKTYLSAYAHNNQILVKEGQSVVKGQKIAELGATDAESPRLHFEIRRLGKPVDPMKFLPAAPQ